MDKTAESKRSDRMAALVEHGQVFKRDADGVRVIGLRNMEEEYELRLDDIFEEQDGKQVRVGEGGQIRVKKGSYLCWNEKEGHYVVDEQTFVKTHRLFVESVQG